MALNTYDSLDDPHPEPSVFRSGDRVITPHGPGSVRFVRMAPPTYSKPEAYSVRLDGAERTIASYIGTVYRAEEVKAEPKPGPK